MSKKLKLSPWHDGSVNPVNFGVYEFPSCADGDEWFRRCDDKYWYWGDTTIQGASASEEIYCAIGEIYEEWRGVLK